MLLTSFATLLLVIASFGNNIDAKPPTAENAAPLTHKFDELYEVAQKFQQEIVAVLMKNACHNHLFAVGVGALKEVQKKAICETGRSLSEKLAELSEEYAKQMKVAKRKKKSGEIDDETGKIDDNRGKMEGIFSAIRAKIFKDVQNLQWIYYDLITTENANPLMQEVLMIRDQELKGKHGDEYENQQRRNFNEAFKGLVAELREILESGKNYDDNVKVRELVYKILYMAEQMGKTFDRNTEESTRWAFQQFAASLAVYALRLDTPWSSDAYLESIGKNWPIGM